MAWDAIERDVEAASKLRGSQNSKRKAKRQLVKTKSTGSSSSSSSDEETAQQLTGPTATNKQAWPTQASSGINSSKAPNTPDESSDLSSSLSDSDVSSQVGVNSTPLGPPARGNRKQDKSMKKKVVERLGQRVVACPRCSKPLLEGAMDEHFAKAHASGNDTSNNKATTSNKEKDKEAVAGEADDLDDVEDDVEKASLAPSTADSKNEKDPTIKSSGDPGDGNEDMAMALKRKEKLAKGKAGGTRKSRGPVDVDIQCGVITDNGVPCQRSLTCKTHSMGAKRSVPGRSGPYDVLLSEWQKRHQAPGGNGNAINATKAKANNTSLSASSSSASGKPQLAMSTTQSGSGVGTPAAIAEIEKQLPAVSELTTGQETVPPSASTFQNQTGNAFLAALAKRPKRKKADHPDEKRWFGEAETDTYAQGDEDDSEMDVEVDTVLESVAGASERRDREVMEWMLARPNDAPWNYSASSAATSALAVRDASLGRFRSALSQALTTPGII